MKGDFTRLTFNPAAHRAAVLQQQGRVQLDADWNEEAAIQLHRWRVQTVDTIGECGAPLHHGGFQVAASVGTGNLPALTLTPGRAYVEGLLCELETPDGKPLSYLQQPYYPNPDPLSLSGLGAGQQRTDLVYVEAWLRHVSALEDPTLIEPALGGPDTATRLQTVWQVRVLPNVGASVDCATDVSAYDALTAPSGGRLTTGAVAIPSASDPCLVNPKGGYSGLENQLYRVEIHAGGALGAASFKWSRDNASIGSRVETFVDGTHLQVESLGRDAYSQFRIGQWVEVIGDTGELDDAHGILAKIADVQPDRTLTLSQDVSAVKAQTNPRVRRWDMADGVTQPQADGTIATAAGPITLDNGVTVSFSGAGFLPGDYWVFAARVAGGSAGGPSVEALTQAPPLGIRRHFCRLALVTWTMTGTTASGQVQQCLPVFPPLTELPAGEGCCTVLQPGPNLGSRLQAALDAIAATGGCVCLPAGDFVLETPVAIRGARRVTLCGCAGAVRLVWSNPEVAALTIAGSQRVTVSGVSLYGSGARELIVVSASAEVEIRDAWLINLPHAGGAAVCVRVAAGTDGVTLQRCSLLGDAALLGDPGTFVKDPQGTAAGGALNVAMERCRVLARAIGVYLPAVQGLCLERSLIAGLPAGTWMALVSAGAGLNPSGLPALDGTLAGLFQAPPTTSGLVPIGVLAISAVQARLARGQIWAGVAFAGVSVQLAGFADNLAIALIGWLSLTGVGVDVLGNRITALLSGVVGAGVSARWQVRGNRLAGRDGVLLSTSASGQELLDRAVAAVAGGLIAFAVGPDGVTMQGAPVGAATGDGGVALSRLIATQVNAAVPRLAGLGQTGSAQTIAVLDNEVACSGLGIGVTAGVRVAGLLIRGNHIRGAQTAGVSLLGSAPAVAAAVAVVSAVPVAAASPAPVPVPVVSDVPVAVPAVGVAPAAVAGTSAALVDGNVVTGSGLGITVETNGTTVAQNTITVTSAGGGKPAGDAIASLFQAVAATQFAAAAPAAGDVRVLRTGFDQLALRASRGDLSAAEAGAVAAQAAGPLATALDGSGLSPAAANLRAGAAALLAGDLQTAAAHLAIAGVMVAAALGNVGIRLAAMDLAASGNAVFAGGTDRGGIWVGMPSSANLPAKSNQPLALRAVAVSDNLIAGGAGAGVEIDVAVSGLSVAGNQIRNMVGCGVLVSITKGTSEVDVSHNRVEDCVGAVSAGAPRAGIWLFGASGVRVVNNTVLRCGANQKATCFGIDLEFLTDVSVRGNTVQGNGGTIAGGARFNGGMSVWFCDGLLQVTDNRCVANQDSALVVVNPNTADARLTVTGNGFDSPVTGTNESLFINVSSGDAIVATNQITYRGKANAASFIGARNAAVLGNIWQHRQVPVLPMEDPLVAARFNVIGNVTDDTVVADVITPPDQLRVNNVPFKRNN